MSRFVDIHTHILPAVDDGSQNREQSLAMIRMMISEGISDIICTPHFYPNRHNCSLSKINEQMEILNKLIMEEHLPVRLYSGNEIYYRSSVPELLETHQVNTLAGSFYVLIEFNPGEEFSYIRNAVYELQTLGYYPILAHAERYSHLVSDMGRTKEIVDMGAYIQINSGSITGEFGREAKRAACEMLKHSLPHFVATDAHDDRKRAPRIRKTIKIISRKYGEEYTQALFGQNPGKIICA